MIFFIKIALVTIIFIGGFILVIDRVYFPGVVNQGISLKVPNLIGKDFSVAVKELEELEFQGIKSKTKVDYKYPENTVINQTPKSGSTCKPGRRIYLTISSGSKPVEVPNLKAISPLDAKYKIQKKKLILDSILYDYSSEYPEGVIMDQTIEEGSLVSVGDSISLVISLGPELDKYIVPNLKEMQLSKAINKINMSGFKVGTISKLYSEELLPNTVISQFPEPEKVTEKGSEIMLYIATIEEENIFIVPNLKDMELSKAVEETDSLIFIINTVSKVYNEELMPNTIISQFPEPETIAEQGTKIVVFISTDEESYKVEEEE